MVSRILSAAILACALAACSIADEYADRAVRYNNDAEDARDQVLLLNILRAKDRKPLQFSDLASVTGTAQASGGISGVLPLLGRPQGFGRLYDADPTAQISGGPSFVVNIENTKEFYQGVLQPFSLQTIALLEAQGFPRTLLYTLVVSKIDLREVDSRRLVASFPNRVFSAAEFKRFADLVDALTDAGMGVQEAEPKPVGAPVSPRDAAAPDLVAKLRAQNLTLSPRKAAGGAAGSYDIVSMSDRYHLCFDDPGRLALPGQPEAVRAAFAAVARSGFCGPDAVAQPHRGQLATQAVAVPRTGTAAAVQMEVTLRSVEGVIFYLGEIAREELGESLDLTTQAATPPFTPTIRVQVKTGEPDRFESFDQPLFSLRPADGDGGRMVTAEYDGARYGVPVSPSGLDHSTQVMELVLATLALSNSAKDQPAPSVITVLGR